MTAPQDVPATLNDPDLIAALYDAAAHSHQWFAAWQTLCAAMGAQAGALRRHRGANRGIETLAALNWPMVASTGAQAGACGREQATAGHCDTLPIILRTAANIAGDDGVELVLVWPGPAEGESVHRAQAALTLFGRHIAAALRLEQGLAAERAASAMLTAALDTHPHGVVLVTCDGTVLFANAASRALTQAACMTLGPDLAGIGPMLPHEARRLAELVADVGAGGLGGCTRITPRTGASGFAAIIDPLPVDLLNPASPGQTRLVRISLRDLGATTDTSSALLMELFGLTAAEAGIVPQLISGESVTLIAQSRGASVNTVKSQAAKVLGKTGAANLRALATMISALG